MASIRMSIFLSDLYKRNDALYILWLIVDLMLYLRISPLGFAACQSKNVPFWRSVCNVRGLMFSI